MRMLPETEASAGEGHARTGAYVARGRRTGLTAVPASVLSL